MSDDQKFATPAEDIVHVLRLADAGWPADRNDWSTDGFAFACWNGLLGGKDPVVVTDAGRKFLDTVGKLYPEDGR